MQTYAKFLAQGNSKGNDVDKIGKLIFCLLVNQLIDKTKIIAGLFQNQNFRREAVF